MIKLIISLALIANLSACTDTNFTVSEAEENSKATVYTYGQTLRVKDGFYKGYGCTMIREYSDSVFCKITYTPDKNRVQEQWQTSQNFKKSNVEPIE